MLALQGNLKYNRSELIEFLRSEEASASSEVREYVEKLVSDDESSYDNLFLSLMTLSVIGVERTFFRSLLMFVIKNVVDFVLQTLYDPDLDLDYSEGKFTSESSRAVKTNAHQRTPVWVKNRLLRLNQRKQLMFVECAGKAVNKFKRARRVPLIGETALQLIPREERSDILGDLEVDFRAACQEKGPKVAKCWYCIWTFCYLFRRVPQRVWVAGVALIKFW